MATFGVTVTLVTTTVTGQDAYGKDILVKKETPILGCTVWPATSGSEATQGQDIITDTLVCLFPPDTIVSARDKAKVPWRTNEYEVTGDSFLWHSSLTDTTPGVQVNLKAVKG